MRVFTPEHQIAAWQESFEEESKKRRMAEQERDRLRGLLRELLDAGEHFDCLPFSGNCPRCVVENEARAELEETNVKI